MVRPSCLTLLWVVSLLVAACGPAPPLVSIRTSTFSVDGDQQVLILWADTTPAGVSYSWKLNGAGALSSADEPSVRYSAPLAEGRAGTAIITLTVTDPQTQLSATDRFTVTLRPELPAAAQQGQATSAPTEAATAAPLKPESLVQISTIAEGERVAQSMTVLGTYPRTLTDDIWVFVVPPNGRFYPQSRNPCAGEASPKLDGRWEMQVGFGGQGDAGQQFTLLVAVAPPAASAEIATTLRQWCASQSFPGLRELPQDVVVAQRRQVTRSGEEWGQAPSISRAEPPARLALNALDERAVKQTMVISGSYPLEITETIWVLVRTAYGSWYPQGINPCGGPYTVQADGQWQTRVVFGGEEAGPEPFDLVAVLADAKASAFFADTLEAWCAANHYPGLLTIELPSGLSEQVRLRVYRAR
jgi:hypothetical protein